MILDLFSRFVVGWAVSAANDRHLTIKALEMALKRRCPAIGLLHHSDQGSTYASEDYQAVLDARGIVCSMSRRGNCWDNAVMESFFSTVKSELADQFASYGDAKMDLFDYIEVFYNQQRRHSTLGQSQPSGLRASARSSSVAKPSTKLDQAQPLTCGTRGATIPPEREGRAHARPGAVRCSGRLDGAVVFTIADRIARPAPRPPDQRLLDRRRAMPQTG